MKYLITLVAMAFLVSATFAATPTPTPTVTPTPVPRVIQDSDYRVPLSGIMLYGNNGGIPVKIKVNADGYLLTMPVPTPTP